jgi:hypothetical protein
MPTVTELDPWRESGWFCSGIARVVMSRTAFSELTLSAAREQQAAELLKK